VSISPEYGEVLAHLRDARAALSKAEQALDLIGPAEARPGALDDLVVGIQVSAELVGRRTAANELRQLRGRAAATAEPAADPSDFLAVANRDRLLGELFGGRPAAYAGEISAISDQGIEAGQ
jgi:hypothetical protein